MAEKFVIAGKRKLEGRVEISGAKNDAGPVIAATLLAREPFVIDNLPLVEDIFCLLEILKGMGSDVQWLEKKKIRIENKNIDPEKLDFSLIGKTRVSVLLIGPMLARFKKLKFSSPGGDKIGLRPITAHLEAFEKLGAKIKEENGYYFFDGENLKGREIVLGEFSVTATENLMMLASGIEGRTIIKMAADEPHVQDLAKMLRDMGAKIEQRGSHTIEIDGQENLKGTFHEIIPDHVETGTFFTIGALTPGILEIKNIILDHLDVFLAKTEEIGVLFEKGNDFLRVEFSPNLKAVKIQALPWPGFPTDLLPIVVPLLTQAKGKSLIHDPLYENRLNFIHELRKMGADIEIVDPHRAFVFGKTPLSGIEISSWDIRAGASLTIAGLMARGKTIIGNISQIDRGYEKIDEKLRKLGADIKRIKD